MSYAEYKRLLYLIDSFSLSFIDLAALLEAERDICIALNSRRWLSQAFPRGESRPPSLRSSIYLILHIQILRRPHSLHLSILHMQTAALTVWFSVVQSSCVAVHKYLSPLLPSFFSSLHHNHSVHSSSSPLPTLFCLTTHIHQHYSHPRCRRARLTPPTRMSSFWHR